MGCVRSAMALWWLSMIIFIVRTRGDIYGHCISSPIVDKNACKKIAEANLEGPIVFTSGPSITEASSDFGGIVKNKPAAVLSPASVGDISKLIKIANESPNLTIAARGNGHAVAGQSQALNGIVVNMTSLRGIQIVQKGGGESYADVKGGEFWVNVLRAAQASGLSPRSWTDYIDLSIGGTLSNAGISGQTYRYGPQISNVLQLEVVTGNGNVTNCSSEDQADLFYSTLGGLGQFGIITGAQIVLQKSFDRASQWRFVYWNFTDFTHDQEILISFTQGGAFDYVEGFVIANNKNGWPSIPFLPNATFNSSLIPPTAGVMLYIIEATLYYDEGTNVNQTVQNISSELGFIRGLEFNLDTSYFDFLYRVHPQELADRANGIWFAPHPWLNLFIPKSGMLQFDQHVFSDILKQGIDGIIICYPMHKSLWNSDTSAILPEDEDDIFYGVSLLYFSKPYPQGPAVSTLIEQNKRIIDYCKSVGIQVKQYLGSHKTQADWIQHFGRKWDQFSQKKKIFDPKGILAPGQKVFPRTS
ncbi:hypothetical protein SUGI_0429950 [Cryptomeria japonica]|nr:hypothetical protein SUGI_0429950 [Cryptomeria japonica]